ncbi:hypothetical protein [Comamonas thiooxydans]|uniref:hypothetical protein n=1 Tax=Comamonas thiooxydans TaxID=363952 RepID=UPI0005F79605|nr:hypothetical protein [Comamonas thiooxydans]CUA99379.1 hypothetical protein Ga0061062_108115 [Comamonas thiooxydans]
MAEAIYIAGFYICFVWSVKQHLAIRVLRRDMNAADERISRYRVAVVAIDKWCGHESPEARLIAAFIGASGEGRSMNGGTPIKDEVCDVSGTRDQLRRLQLAAQAHARDAGNEWQDISTLPTCDDLIWLYCQDTNTVDGPVAPSPIYEDSWTHWAYAEAPSTASINRAAIATAKEGGTA